jgi:hypothetical protein
MVQDSDGTEYVESDDLFGMAGSGGTAAYADSGTALALAVTKNRNTRRLHDVQQDRRRAHLTVLGRCRSRGCPGSLWRNPLQG